MRSRPKPPPVRDAVQIAVRVDEDIIARADGLTDYLTRAIGKPMTRTGVFRAAIVKGLAALERAREKRQ